MAVSHNDKSVLAGDATFQARVKTALLIACINIGSEARTVPASFPAWAVADYYRRRAQLTDLILRTSVYEGQVVNTVATDATVISAATVNGTVPLTGANVAAQQALVTDAQIDNAIGDQFNAFVEPNA